jgi:hypothetical protein
MTRDDIQRYLAKNWQAANAPSAPLSPVEALRRNAEALAALRAANPDWPGDAARAEDLACHLRVCELLRRVDG